MDSYLGSSPGNLLLDQKYLSDQLLASAVPLGTVLMRNSDDIPAGYLRWGEGGSYDPAVYPQFAAYMTANFPSLTSGNLPDYRNYSPRTVGPLTSANGQTQEDAMQGHWHNFDLNAIALSVTAGSDPGYQRASSTTSQQTNATYGVHGPITDGVNGTPRTASETRVKTFACRWVIKAYGAFVETGSVSLVAIQTAQAASVRFDAQTLSNTQKQQVWANIGLYDFETFFDQNLTAASGIAVGDVSAYRSLELLSYWTSSGASTLLLQLSVDNVNWITTGYLETSVDNGNGTIGGLTASNRAGFSLSRYSGSAGGWYNSRLTINNLKCQFSMGVMAFLRSSLRQPDNSVYDNSEHTILPAIATYTYAKIVVSGSGTFTGNFIIRGKR